MLLRLSRGICDTMVMISFCLLQVLIHADAMAIFMSKSSTNRYFTHQGVLPPLPLAELPSSPSNSTIIPYSVSETSVVPVTYTNDPKTVYLWLTENLPLDGCILGVDLESVSPRPPQRLKGGSRKSKSSGRLNDPFENAATVQLATPDACLVVHLVRKSGHFSYACAPILKAIFADERYIMAGCALDDDFVALQKVWGTGGSFDAKSRLDLGLIGIQSPQDQRGPTTRTRHGLKSLCRRLLNIDLPKPKSLALSDWSHVPLSEDQIIYAARDAWAGAMIGQKLQEYDPETFNVKYLMQILPERETSISTLAFLHKRRNQAKRDLTRLLAPFQERHMEDLPRKVYEKARDLRVVIKRKVVNTQLVFETSHLNLD